MKETTHIYAIFMKFELIIFFIFADMREFVVVKMIHFDTFVFFSMITKNCLNKYMKFKGTFVWKKGEG